MCKYANLKGVEVKTAQQVEVLAKVLSRKSRTVTFRHSRAVPKNGKRSSDFGIKRPVTR